MTDPLAAPLIAESMTLRAEVAETIEQSRRLRAEAQRIRQARAFFLNPIHEEG